MYSPNVGLCKLALSVNYTSGTSAYEANKSKSSLWREVGCVTSKHQAPQEYATNYRKEVADVHCHHRQHAAERLAIDIQPYQVRND